MIILIVEDNINISEGINKILKKIIKDNLPDEEIMIKSTSHVKSAIELATELSIDVFVIDIELPDGNGLVLGQTIRNMERYSRTPMIIESKTINEKFQVDVHLKLNNLAYITKPFNLNIFAEKLIYALEIASEKSRMITIITKKSRHNYDIKDVVYIEKCSYSKNCQLIWYEKGHGLHSETYTLSIKKMKACIKDSSIIQIHQSYMINPIYISRIDLMDKIIMLKHNIEIPIGQTYLKLAHSLL